ncbi:vWA domain-containing protein [Sinisalibacter aestuarii]|uniref:VWFA domain-containing protein n=1 Tax=Sinisalibacter aestuarii TaxID=2949426 RepID=A0ABQ5LSH9_9RHOB|nr:VWA domain-containing protein [Sinisalibacter aestuarii]GKY87942.1 hypothetical protein STA1M1_18110 [Sinisalibacter aestuarii]
MLRLLAFVLFLLPGLAFAQGAPRTILVLDGSGSMWGQIDGVNKIVIAREVMADLLATLPAERELGLMSYGHRRKGDCADIEMLIEPGTDRAAIADAVNAINPKGKTPLSAAVIQAAEALRYTEEEATVILISDGIETCELDPCAVGRELEATGVGFTAHVIGFDVADPEALAQLQCLAEETGGQFRTAGNADELAEALDVVVAEPEPEPEPEPFFAEVTFRATEGENGPQITEGLHWVIGSDEGGPEVAVSDEATLTVTLPAATSRADVTRLADEATASEVFTLTETSPTSLTVTLVLPPFAPPASLDAPGSAPAGSVVPVTWQGPNAERDYLVTATADMSGSQYIDYSYLESGEGNTVMLQMPPEPGTYELRYILTEGNKVLATRMIEITPLTITLAPPEAATIGQDAPVNWTGPGYPRDYISVAAPDQPDNQYVTYSYVENGSPLDVRMPPEPGSYELRYVLGASGHVAARMPFEVGDTATSVNGPAEAAAGATITVGWTGPDAQNDYIAIAPVGSPDNQYKGYTYTEAGNPLELRLPQEPGEYELRYVLNQKATVLARSPITLTPVTATLDAPESAAAGSALAIGWSGPDYDRDYVAIAPLGAKDGDYVSYGYTGNGNPATFQAPTEPGEYELRYIANDNGSAVIARRPITIVAVTASLDAPASAPAGSTRPIGWTGPGSTRDYIAIARPADAANRYETYEYTRDDKPVEMDIPAEPGSYELRYIQAGSPAQILASMPFEVTAVSASLAAAPTAPAGGTLSVTWEGPGYSRDYIAIAGPGDAAAAYESYEYAHRGSPLIIDVPDEPGAYELRYVISNRAGRAVIGAVPLTVE